MIKIAILLLIAALFFIVVMVIDNHRFVVREYTVRSPLIRYPVRVVFIADLHEKDYGNDNEKLVLEIAGQKPDLILIGGDLIVSGAVVSHNKKNSGSAGSDVSQPLDTEWMKKSLALMKKLTRICPVWFVRGNHEIRLGYYEEFGEYDALFRDEMEGAGVRFLENRCVDPAAEIRGGKESGICLHGLELPMESYKKFTKTTVSQDELVRLMGRPDPSSFNVLLTHTPVHFPQYALWGADLCLCGHVHGGLMRLPLIGGVMGTRPNLFPKYSGGQYSYDITGADGERTSTLIVTCGLGMHTLPIRIFNPGEISVIELAPAGDG